MGLSQKENKNCTSNLVSKILGAVQNYIFELFKILQCKTGNEFRKSHLFESLGESLTFP